MKAIVDYSGELYEVTADTPICVGREGDLVIDDNPYLHRRFLEFSYTNDLLWLANVGSTTMATVADGHGLVQTWLSPGARIPLVFPHWHIWFTAGPTTYEIEVRQEAAPFASAVDVQPAGGDITMGRVSLTPDQKLLILALAEEILRRGNRGAGTIPQSATAAARLGWTTTKFNRKLDNVCEKLAGLGARGLLGNNGSKASNRRVRLVEYALATRLVTAEDIVWLDSIDQP